MDWVFVIRMTVRLTRHNLNRIKQEIIRQISNHPIISVVLGLVLLAIILAVRLKKRSSL